MFLHSGASLHGHEYSHKDKPPSRPRPRPQPALPGLPVLPALPALRKPLRSSLGLPHTSPASSTASSTASTASSRHSISLGTPTTPLPASTTLARSNTVSDGPRAARALRPQPHPSPVSAAPTPLASTPNSPRQHPVVRFHDPVVVDSPLPPPSPLQRSFSASLPLPHTPASAAPRLRYSSLQSAAMASDDALSVSASEASYASEHPPSSAASMRVGRRGSVKRAGRKSTTYLLAHPAPKLSRKKTLLHRIRPTLLMQLQKISPDSRPLPVIDVYPSSLLVGNVTAPRFSKRFPRLFGINGELGLHDTILVQSDTYQRPGTADGGHGGHDGADDDDDSFEHRSLMGVFSPLRGGDHSEIVLEDGTVWTTTALPTGSYEFTHTDEHGRVTTARWVRRLAAKRTSGANGTPLAPVPSEDGSVLPTPTLPAPPHDECKFIFSVIDPQSRRHPILATLTKVTLSILDRYTTVSPASRASSRYPASRSWTASPAPHDTDTSNDELSHDEDADTPATASIVPATATAKGRATLPVDDKLKHFITVSSIWVALQCGWGQSPSSGTPCAMPHSCTNTPAGSLKKVRGRQLSEPVTAGEAADNASRGRRLSGRYSRRSGTFSLVNGSEGAVAVAVAERDASPSAGRGFMRSPLFPRKASSTGAAYVRRQKQLQHLSDTSDSEHPAAAAGGTSTPKRRSRAFSRLSGDFSSIVSSKLHHSPSPTAPPSPPSPDASASKPKPPSRPPSRTNSLRLPSASPDTHTAARTPRSVSAYYTTSPLPPTDALSPAYVPALVPGVSTGLSWEEQQHRILLQEQLHLQQHQVPRTVQAVQAVHAETERAGTRKWKRMSTWFKARLHSSH